MGNHKSKTSDLVARDQRVTLLDLLDRLLDKGVMVKGEIMLSVADIDLVYLNLGLLLSSVKTVESVARSNGRQGVELSSQQIFSQGGLLHAPQQIEGRIDILSTPSSKENSKNSNSDRETSSSPLPAAISNELNKLSKARTDVDDKNIEKGLVKLVLTLVDLIRKLMEKQAIRRIEHDQLSDREIEDVGNAFLLLDEKMNQLKKKFGLKDEDLNLDLGPLGELV